MWKQKNKQNQQSTKSKTQNNKQVSSTNQIKCSGDDGAAVDVDDVTEEDEQMDILPDCEQLKNNRFGQLRIY